MPSPRPFTYYISEAPEHWDTDLGEYERSPATAFLREICHEYDAFTNCRNLFTKKLDNNYTKDSQDSLHRIAAAMLAAVMGHFETFQRTLFAGVFEWTTHLPNYDISPVCSRLEKAGASIALKRVAAFRGKSAAVGLFVADSLGGWHDPERVNSYFSSVVRQFTFYSTRNVRDLQVLWQLRHSIVHTAGWITLPDAQKVNELAEFGERAIVLDNNFVNTLVRRLHSIVRDATTRVDYALGALLDDEPAEEAQERVNELLDVASPKSAWL